MLKKCGKKKSVERSAGIRSLLYRFRFLVRLRIRFSLSDLMGNMEDMKGGEGERGGPEIIAKVIVP